MTMGLLSSSSRTLSRSLSSLCDLCGVQEQLQGVTEGCSVQEQLQGVTEGCGVQEQLQGVKEGCGGKLERIQRLVMIA